MYKKYKKEHDGKNKPFEDLAETKMSEASFFVPREENITATITSVNQVGEAHNASTIHIPQYSSQEKISKVDAIVVDMNNTYAVYWKHEDSEGTVTIFWCFNQTKYGVQWLDTDINSSGVNIPSMKGSAVLPVYLAVTVNNNVSTDNNAVMSTATDDNADMSTSTDNNDDMSTGTDDNADMSTGTDDNDDMSTATDDNDDMSTGMQLVSTGMQRVTCTLVPEHRMLEPILKLRPSSSQSNRLVFLYHFSTCPSTNPSPYVRSYVFTYQEESTTKGASTVSGSEAEILLPNLTPGSCYLFQTLDITTMDGQRIKTNYNKTHCTAPASPPRIISAVVNESNPDQVLVMLEPPLRHEVSPVFAGKSSCKLDVEGREHVVDCGKSSCRQDVEGREDVVDCGILVVLPHSIRSSSPCPSIRTSLCTPRLWPPQECSPWSTFYTIVQPPAAPIINKLTIRPNTMLEVEYVAGPAKTCEVRTLNLSTRDVNSHAKSHNGRACNNNNKSINNISIINNSNMNNSVTIQLDLCQQYNISVRCGIGIQTGVDDINSMKMSPWSAPHTTDFSCNVPLTSVGKFVGIGVGLLIGTIVISILFIRTSRYIQKLRKRFAFSDELGDIALSAMNHERMQLFPAGSGVIFNNMPRTYQETPAEQKNHTEISEPPNRIFNNISRKYQEIQAPEGNYVVFSKPPGSILNNIPRTYEETQAVQENYVNIPVTTKNAHVEKNGNSEQPIINGYTILEDLIQN